MIENYSKDAGGNINFTLHGIDYRIADVDIHIFTQQEIISLVSSAADAEGNFMPFSEKGIIAQRKILQYIKHVGSSVNDLNENYQKKFYSSDDLKKTVSAYEDDSGQSVTNVTHIGFLSVYAQGLIINEGLLDMNNKSEKKSKADELPHITQKTG